MRRKLGKYLCSLLVTMSFVISSAVGVIPGLVMTVHARTEEILLTTVTYTNGGSQTHSTEGVVTVELNGVTFNDDTYGWLFFENGTVTVTPADGVEITKVRFRQNAKNPIDDDLAPFTLTFTDGMGSIETSTGTVSGRSMDGVTSIEVYGSTTIEEYTVTYEVVNGTWEDGTTDPITEDVEEGSSPSNVPTGMIAASGYTGGSWDTDPASATITEDTTFTYTFEAESVDPDPVDPTKPDTPTPEPVTPASESEVPADTTPSGSSSSAPVVSAEQSRAMTVSNFVERLYLTALNRSYDVTGRDNWVDQITNKDASGSAIARGFFNSQEFIARELDNEEFVNTLYRVFFDREPDTQGFANWINALENGATRSEVINGFTGSTEWTSMCARFGINT